MFRATMGRALGFNGSSPPPPSPQIEIKSCAHFNFNSKAGLRACITRKRKRSKRRKARRKNEIGARRALCSIASRAGHWTVRRRYTRIYAGKIGDGIFINTIILVLEIYIRCEIRHYLHFEQIAEKTDIKIYVDKAWFRETVYLHSTRWM